MSGSVEPRVALPQPNPYVGEIQFARPRPIGSTGSYALLILFLCMLYTNLTLLVPALEALRPAQIVAICGIMMLFIELMISRRGICMVWPESYLMLAFLGATILSTVTALWPRLAVECVSNLTKMAIVYFLIVNSVESETRLRGVIWTLLFGGLAPAVGAIQNHLRGVFVENGRAAWVGIFGNPNELAYGLVLLVPLAILMGTTSPSRLLRFLAWAILPVYFAAIYFTYSRGGLIGLAAVLALMGLRMQSPVMKSLVWIVLIAGALFVSNNWTRGEGFKNVSEDLTFQQRMATIQVGYKVFFDRPLLGAGIGCSVLAWPLYAPKNLYTHGAIMIHNTLVQALCETGILGFVPYVALILASLYHAWKMARACAESGREGSGRLARALEVSLWGFVVCGMSGGYVITWFSYLLFGLISSAKRLIEAAAVSSDGAQLQERTS